MHSAVNGVRVCAKARLVGDHVAKFLEYVHFSGQPNARRTIDGPEDAWHRQGARRTRRRCAMDHDAVRSVAPESELRDATATQTRPRAATDPVASSCTYSEPTPQAHPGGSGVLSNPSSHPSRGRAEAPPRISIGIPKCCATFIAKVPSSSSKSGV